MRPRTAVSVSVTPGGCAWLWWRSPGCRSQRHTSTGAGRGLVSSSRALPPEGPLHSGATSPASTTTGPGSTRASSISDDTDRPSASARRTSVVRFGLPRAPSRATRAPLLTSARAASASSDRPAATRADRTLRATMSSAASGMAVVSSYATVIAMTAALLLALTSSLAYGAADFLGGLAARGAHVLRVVVIAAPVSLLVELVLWPAVGARFVGAAVAWGAASGLASAAA